MVELRIERTVHGGISLARMENGRIVLVPGVIPGELVRAEVHERAGVLRADSVEVIEASADRVRPESEHPGLDFGFIRYERQLQLKREVLQDALARATRGGAPEAEATVPSPTVWRYRSSVQPAVVAGGLGYRRPGTGDVVPLAVDPVANEAIAAAWTVVQDAPIPKGVREFVLKGNDDGDVLIGLIATSPQRSLLQYAHDLVDRRVARGVSYARFDARGRFRGGSERLAGERTIEQAYGRFRLSVSVPSFAQPNPGAASSLYLDAAGLAGGGTTAVELFAGSGALSLHLAGAFERVAAVEIDKASVARGRADAERLGIDAVEFLALDARHYAMPAGVELVAVDPPRAGLSRDVREMVDASRASRLLYVSCDPATWARDAADLVERGWRLDSVRPYDFYPHTHHVEVLSLLSR